MPELLLIACCYLLTGLAAGLCAGLFGLGGGVVVVPALFFLFSWQAFPAESLMHLAIGSSLAAVLFAGLTSTLAHHRRGAVAWPVVAVLAPGLVLGALLGSLLADWVPSRALQWFFGLFELAVALQILLDAGPRASRRLPARAGLGLVGLLIGVLSALLGIGGGSVTVPYLIWSNVPLRTAIATSAACGVPIALAGALGFVFSGWTTPGLPAGSTGYVNWPVVGAIAAGSVLAAPWGARLAHALPVQVVRRLFALVVGAVAVEMLLS